MAFGFSRPTAGLIVDLPGQPSARGRFTLDFAHAYADAVTVVVCGSAAHAAAIDTRVGQLRAQYPDVEFIESLDSPSCAGATTAALAARHFDLVFSADLVAELSVVLNGAHRVPTFADAALRYMPPERLTQSSALPVAGLMSAGTSTLPPALSARSSSSAHSVPPPRPPLLRVCLFGPESTGKSTLAAALARHYRTTYAADYVRAYLDAVGSNGAADDVPWIARGQLATEAAVATRAERLLIADTSLASIALWSDVLYGATPEWIHAQALRQRYDLWLLTDIDVLFEPDPLRCFPDAERRAWFMTQCQRTLERLGVDPMVLRGSAPERLQLACSVIDRMLAGRV